jgi:hypothetical protein
MENRCKISYRMTLINGTVGGDDRNVDNLDGGFYKLPY